MTAEDESGRAPLAPRRVLVVEDETVLLMMLEDALTDAGCVPVTASRVAKAAALAETGAFDCAILDVNVNGEFVFPVATILSRRKIPFVLSTGYGRASLPAAFRDRPILAKPYLPENIKQAVAAVLPL
jgi:CheY-like chemotaxis protein